MGIYFCQHKYTWKLSIKNTHTKPVQLFRETDIYGELMKNSRYIGNSRTQDCGKQKLFDRKNKPLYSKIELRSLLDAAFG